MASDGKFFHESMQDVQSIKSFLETLQKGLENGRIVLGSSQEEFTLNPPDLFTLSIKAKKKDGSSKLQLKIVWEDKQTQTGTANQPLTIKS